MLEAAMSSIVHTHDERSMTGYSPAWRRPIARGFRMTAHMAVRFCVNHGIHADTVSYSSILASAAAALCFWRAADSPWLLLVAPVFCYVRLWLNMLDGMVALAECCGRARWGVLGDFCSCCL